MDKKNLSTEQISEILSILKDNGIEFKNQDVCKSWLDNLKTTKNGYANNIRNYHIWFQNGSNKYTNKLRYNAFFDYIEYNDDMIKDEEEGFIEEDAETFFDHAINIHNLDVAFRNYVYEHSYNPIVEYLDSLKGKWDGKPRLETFIIDLLEADDIETNRFFSKTWMIAGVKRAYEPGCQFDSVLMLQGGVQGSGKSNLIKCLTLNKYYKIFSADEFKSKDCIDKMNQSWITFLDEFDKYGDKEVADLKCKITETKMACRKAYGHNTREYSVHWIYAAATNADDFLCDLTGDGFERRYWIIECHKNTVDSKVKDTMTKEYVDQLWAEAVYYYFKDPNQKLWLDSSNPLYEKYKEYQRKFKKTASNTAITYIDEILNKKYSVDSKGCFKDSIDMHNQFTDNKIYEHTEFINRVPCSYVRFILKKVYGVDYSPKMIKSIIMMNGDEWELKNAKYLGKTQSNVLCRRKEIKNEELDYSKTNSLPF